jgi:hypothetical protein
MISDAEVKIAEWILKQACREREVCDECSHGNNCILCNNYTCPDTWDIPDPPPEPTERPRIEWLRMLPDVEMLNTAVRMNKTFDCKDCNIHSDCSPCTGNECNVGHMDWWHEVVTMEQFRKDVGMNNDTDS